jgi:hypothetical protein
VVCILLLVIAQCSYVYLHFFDVNCYVCVMKKCNDLLRLTHYDCARVIKKNKNYANEASIMLPVSHIFATVGGF